MNLLPNSRDLRQILLITLGHILLVAWALRLVAPDEGISLMWLPNGYLLACLVLQPVRLWPALLGTVVAAVFALEGLTTDRPIGQILLFLSANMVESLGGAALFRALCGGREGLRTFRDLALFLTTCVVALPAASATIGAAAVVAFGPDTVFSVAYFRWWSSSGLGILFVAPLILQGVRIARHRGSWFRLGNRELLGTIALMLLVVALSSLANTFSDGAGLLLVVLSLPLLCWAAVHFGLWGALTASAALVISAVHMTAVGVGPFSGQGASPSQAVFQLQAYLGAAIIASSFTGMAVENLRSASDALVETSARFRALFESSPTSLWEEDLSKVKQHLERLRAAGVQNIAAWLRTHPEELAVFATEVRVTNINQRTIEMFGHSRTEPREGLGRVLSRRSIDAFREGIVALDDNQGSYRTEGTHLTSDGRELSTLTGVAVVPGHEEDWSRVIVSVEDISVQKAAERSAQESRSTLEELLQSLDAGVVVRDASGHVLLANQRAEEILALEPTGDLGSSGAFEPPRLADGDGTPLTQDQLPFERILESGQRLENELVGLLDADGEIGSWMLVSGAPLLADDGTVDKVIVSYLDITELQEAEGRLRESEVIFANTSEGVTITDLDGTIVDVNRAFCRITGYNRGEVIGKNPRVLQSGRHGPEFYQAMWSSLEKSGEWRGEIWNRRKDGNVYPELLTISTVRGAKGEPTGYVAVFTDLTAIKQSEERLDRLTHYDPLTDLPNRLLFYARLRQGMPQADRHRSMLGTAVIDLDQFKHINDSLGHPAGDELLREVADRLNSALRSEDTVARIGGDEFGVLLQDLADADHAALAVHKLIDSFKEPFTVNGNEIRMTASIGLSLFPTDGTTAATLMRNADAAVFRAKEAGRNTFQFYDRAFTNSAHEHLFLDSALRNAIAEDQLSLAYQPQFDLASGRLVGVEALVRWHHPEQGVISPARFIPIAEQSSLIRDIGEWVLREACRQAKAWTEDGLDFGRVAVNVAGPQIAHPDFVDTVRGALRDHRLPSDRLAVEVTESSLLRDTEDVVRQLQALQDDGVEIAIDDFGTGYSSLSYLKKLPVDKLKIDQSFVRDIPNDTDDMAIAEAVIGMGRSLGLRVIAEGVETEEQAGFLRQEGCEEAQGYLYSRPLPANEVRPQLEEGRSALGRSDVTP